MLDGFVSVKDASEEYGYSESHIRNLLAQGKLKGEKFAGVWIVDRQSVQEHQCRMEQLGKKKHGAWAKNDEKSPALSEDRAS
jgi:hypothetical protein